jgi:hypothetical protein
MTEAKKPACPSCGDPSHVYARPDLRWNDEKQRWEFCAQGLDYIECTECDCGSSIDSEPLDLEAGGFPDPEPMLRVITNAERITILDALEALQERFEENDATFGDYDDEDREDFAERLAAARLAMEG